MAKRTTAANKANSNIEKLKKIFEYGNFYAVRRRARKILSSDDSSKGEVLAAQQYFTKTGIDPIVFIVGAACLIFIIAVAFWAAY